MSDKTAGKRTIFLSRSERRIGGRLFLRFSGFNGFGISFLGDAPVTLLAIYFGAGNMELGLIAAMIHISGIALLIVPRIFKGRNVVTVGFWAWMIRGLVGLPYSLLLFIQGKTAVALIMTLYALFCLSRTAGVAMVTTIQKRLMVSRTQSDLIFRTATSYQGNQILSRFISFIILSLKQISELVGLIVLPFLGVIFNTAAAFTLKKVPNRTKVDYKPGENLIKILIRFLKIPQSRNILILRWISLAQLILFGMAVPFLRRSVGIDIARIFLFTIAISLGAFLSSLSLRPIAARAGSRPLLFFTAIPGVLFFLLWTFIPENYSLEVFAIAGFITMYVLNASNLAVNRLLISITPDNGAVGFFSMETFVTSILAIIIGFSAGYLADISEILSSRLPINDYGLVFLPAAVGSLVQVLLILRIKEPGSMGLAESARILTNINNLRAWQTISNIETTADPIKRKTLIHSMGHNRAPVVSSEIGKILAEPLSQEKGELIEALFLTRRPELADFLYGEAADPAAFHREKAIFALGAYPGRETEKILETLLNDDDPTIRAAASKSLGRIGSKGHLEKIKEMWQQSESLHERLDFMIAMLHMDTEKLYLNDVFSPRIIVSGEKSERTIFTLISRQFGMSPPLGILYREESTHYGRGLELLLEESMDTSFLLEQSHNLESHWEEQRYRKIWELCRSALKEVDPPPELVPITRALLQFPIDMADSANTLAVLFFTYQILTAEGES